MENTVTISIEEYSKLLSTSNSYDDLLDSNCEAIKEINKLNSQIDVLKDIILENLLSKYMLNFTEEQLTDISSTGSFPFNYSDLKRASISVEYAIDWIIIKKRKLIEENNNEH